MAQEPLVRQARMRGRDWRRVAHGLYVPASATGGAHLHALATTLHPGGGFTHLTVAHLLGWWLPPLPAGLPEFAAQDDDRNRPRRGELRIIRTTPPPEIWWLHGLPLVGVTDALLAMSRHLGLLDVVVALDSALRSGHLTQDQLRRVLATRRHGVRRLRSAAALADPRSESPFETLLRILHLVLEVFVEPQHELWDTGRLVARGDLRLVGHQTWHEYDGGGHRDREQQRADLRRDRDLERRGWVRRGYTDLEVLHRPVEVLRDVDRTLGRAHDPSRLESWYDLLRESCFTPAGRHRLLVRLELAD
jgi:hypothetical protein